MKKFEKKLRKEFGVFLREKRVKAGLTQKDMSEMCGYDSAQYISNIERGLCPIPPKVLKLMSDEYHIPVKKLAKLYNAIDLKVLEKQMEAAG